MDGRTRPLGLCCPGPAACEPSGRGHHPHPRPRPGVASSFPRAAPRHRPTPPGRARTTRPQPFGLPGARREPGGVRCVSRSSPAGRSDEESPDSGGSRRATHRETDDGGAPDAHPRLPSPRRPPTHAHPRAPERNATSGHHRAPNIATTLSRLAVSLVEAPDPIADYLDAISSRVVVFDGGMGATLERSTHRRGLRRAAGQVPRGARSSTARTSSRASTTRWSNRARRSSETDTFQACRLKLDEWGLARPHARDQPQGGRDRAQGRRRAALRRGLDRPDRPPARLRRPDPRQDPASASSSRSSPSRPRAARGRRRPADHRDRAGHPRGQGVDLRRARGVQARRAQRADPGGASPPAPGRQDAPRHRHRERVLTTLEALDARRRSA